jgi:hypothetical protein
MESLQESVSKGHFHAPLSPVDILIVRHVLEHAHDLSGFGAALCRLAKENGRIFLEVPDCEETIRLCDYSMLWEEHVQYFTLPTFHETMRVLGLLPISSGLHDCGAETVLWAVAHVAGEKLPQAAAAAPQTQPAVRQYVEALPAFRERLAAWVHERHSGGVVALFGAGHQSSTFLHITGLQGVSCVLDDHPNKQQRYLPGQIPILPGNTLELGAISLCLMGVNPSSEAKIMQKYSNFTGRGGELYSIFPHSPAAIPIQRECLA